MKSINTGKDQLILIEVDAYSEMSKVSLNGELIMEGNHWDFHNGCHGIYDFGKFDCRVTLAMKIYQWLIKIWGIDFRKIKTERRTYAFHDKRS